MLYLKDFERVESFDECKSIVFQLHEFSIPFNVKIQAKNIDGDKYDVDKFGVCVNYNPQIPEVFVSSESWNSELFYVDYSGNKHWFEYKLSEIEKYFFVNKCMEVISKEIYQEKINQNNEKLNDCMEINSPLDKQIAVAKEEQKNITESFDNVKQVFLKENYK